MRVKDKGNGQHEAPQSSDEDYDNNVEGQSSPTATPDHSHADESPTMNEGTNEAVSDRDSAGSYPLREGKASSDS